MSKRTIRMVEKVIIKGKIVALSGIMVGGTNNDLGIGGIDKQVVRNPINNMPYLPGSSLKGKMRSLIELHLGTIGENNGPSMNPNAIAARLFGYIKDRSNNKTQQASRVIVRDAEITQDSVNKIEELLESVTEVKAENTIDRITSEANPRFFERVIKGAEFNLEIVLNVFEGEQDSKEEMINHIFTCLRLIKDDYIGGSGSRGNGQVAFNIEFIEGRGVNYYKTGQDTEDLSGQIPADLKLIANAK